MFDHVTIRVSDRDASRRFYDCVLAPLGHRLTHPGEHFDEWHDFGIAQADEHRPVTRRLHVAFVAGSTADVDAFWRAGSEGGYASDGEPGPRPIYHEAYYGAFLVDPDGSFQTSNVSAPAARRTQLAGCGAVVGTLVDMGDQRAHHG